MSGREAAGVAAGAAQRTTDIWRDIAHTYLTKYLK